MTRRLAASGGMLLLVLALGITTGCGDDGNKARFNLDEPDDNVPGGPGLVGQVTSQATGSAMDEYVTVTAVDGAGTASSTQTTTTGSYVLPLAAGTYDVTYSRPGYEDVTLPGVTVVAGAPTAQDGALSPLAANTYVSSEDCGVCHTDTFERFRRSGHPYKINQVVDGQMPTYPFSTLAGALEMVTDDDTAAGDPKPGTDNTLGTPLSYADVSYVIGGFGWKARFIGLDGFIVTGSGVQYNLATTAVAGYHDNETDKPFNCGNCHTTGWQHHDDVLHLNRQDGLAGMHGTFAAPGIQCESCHGAGSTHAQTIPAGSSPITVMATPRTTAQLQAPDAGFGLPVACSDCHTRDGEKDYPTYEGGPGRIATSGGLVRHHEQYDELLGIDPDNVAAGPTGAKATMHCISCHDPHNTTIYQGVSGDSPGVATSCLTCHPTYEITSGGMQGLACTDCHMPLLAKSAIKTFDPGPGDDRPALGDIRSHVFRIDLTKDPATEQFTADGKYLYPWITGQWACRTCHSTSGSAFNIDFPSGMTIHN